MAKKIISIAVVLAIALGGWFAYYFSDKEVIKRQLHELAVELSKEGKESPVQMALKLKKVKDMLADPCRADIPERNYSKELERDLIIQYLIYHRNRYAFISMTFADLEIDIPAEGKAEVDATVRLMRHAGLEEDGVEELYQVEISMAKGEDAWLLHAVTMPEALTR